MCYTCAVLSQWSVFPIFFKCNTTLDNRNAGVAIVHSIYNPLERRLQLLKRDDKSPLRRFVPDARIRNLVLDEFQTWESRALPTRLRNPYATHNEL